MEIKECREEEDIHKNFILVRQQPVPTSIKAATANSKLNFQSTIPVFYLAGATKIEENLAVFNLHKKSKYSKSIWNLLVTPLQIRGRFQQYKQTSKQTTQIALFT